MDYINIIGLAAAAMGGISTFLLFVCHHKCHQFLAQSIVRRRQCR